MPKSKVTLVVAIGVIVALILLGLSLFRWQSRESMLSEPTEHIPALTAPQ